MAMQNHVRNPLEWGWDHLKQTSQVVGSAANSMDGAWEDRASASPTVRRITATDIGDALARGVRDFGACRTDVMMLCLLYPLAGLAISRMAFDYGMLALVFPLIAGFALIAPVFGLGLYEISRRRERGLETHWTDAFAVARSANIGSIIVMGLLLLAIFCLWLFAANFLYTVTLGPDAPVSAVPNPGIREGTAIMGSPSAANKPRQMNKGPHVDATDLVERWARGPSASGKPFVAPARDPRE